ncbi:MAG: class I SAM-dependent methyltransferase [Myxococcota bacterium]
MVAEYARAQTDMFDDDRGGAERAASGSGSSRWLALMAEGVRCALDLPEDRVHLKTRRTRPVDGPRYKRLSAKKRRHSVRERGLSFWVNLDDYIDTGLFLDHRQTRAWVGAEAAGRHVLNLYGYTGSFTCYAAAGAAKSTTTVDRSSTYLEWMKDNLRLNRLERRKNDAVQSTAEEFLIDARRNHRRWDLIILDPPSRSTLGGPQGRGLELARDYRWLVERSLDLLSPSGLLLFSFNHQRLEPDLGGLRAKVSEMTTQTVPEDFQPHRPHRAFLLQAP